MDLSGYSLIHTSRFKHKCEPLFSSRFANYRLHQRATRLQVQLNSIGGGTTHLHISTPPTVPHFDLPHAAYVPVTLRILVKKRDPMPIRNLLSRLSPGTLSRDFTARYTEDLSRCVDALERRSSTSDMILNSPRQPVLDAIRTTLSPRNPSENVLFEAGLWPSIGPENLLGQLTLHSRKGLSNNWRKVLTSLAENLATQQQALRLNTFERLGLDAEYRQEAENSGSQGWDILAYPDWLLIQLDANLLIRPVQASIAKAMMMPESQTNAVMQLNMGEGKSSVSLSLSQHNKRGLTVA